VISANLRRRHLTTPQRAAIAAELAKMQHGGDRTKASNDALTDAQAARLMAVSEPSVERAKRRMRTDSEAHAKAKAGTLPRKRPTAKELAYRGATDYRRAVAQGNARRELEACDATTGFGTTGRDSKPKDRRPGIAQTVMNLNIGWTWEAVKSFAEVMDDDQRKLLDDHLGDLIEKLHYLKNVLGTEPALSPPEPAPEELAEELADEQPQPNGAEPALGLGRRVREARNARGLSQRELAAAAGTHGPVISQSENGKLAKVGKAALQRVVDVLEVQPL
jgi:hypothetical protein